MDTLVIENHAYPVPPPTTDPRYAAEENIMWAQEALEDIANSHIPIHFAVKYNIRTRQEWLLFLCSPVARHYQVNKDELLEAWMKHYGPSHYQVLRDAFFAGLMGPRDGH